MIIVLLSIFLSVGYMGQTFFLEQFYINSKVSTMKHELESFTKAYETGEWDAATLSDKITSFYQSTSSQIVIWRNGILLYYGDEYKIIVEADGERISVPLNNILYGDQGEEMNELGLEEGMEIYMEGSLSGDVFVPSFIQTSEGKEFTNAQSSGPNVMKITGKIVEKNLPSSSNLPITTQMMLLDRAIFQWRSKLDVSTLSEEILVVDYTDSTTGTSNKLFVRPILSDEGDVEEVIFSLISLQPIGEAVEVIRDFYVYIIGILLVFAGLFAFSISKYLAYSFQKINRVTQKMAQLDFSETIEVTSEDEIGSLSKNINQLSKNLKENIEELQVANERLQEDIEKERKLENTRKEFISGVSHELKTPLSIIKSYSEAIKDGITQGNPDYYVDVILQESEKMDVLIVDMLELAKLESGTYAVRQETFSIIELIDDVNYKLMFKMQDKDMDIDVDTVDDYMVVADRSRMEQVFTNFITNAIRYGQESTTIIIRLAKEENQLKISVENEGEPLAPEKMEKLWERFYRADSARTRNSGGTGLGLSIVKNILQLHKVEFGVYNLDNGVAFYFYLPLDVEGKGEEIGNQSIDKDM